MRRDLAAVIAREIDYQALFGDGLLNKPLGVANQTSVNTPTLATPSWAEVLGVIASIQGADADVGSLGWAMNPLAVAALRAEPVATNGELMIMTEPRSLAGYPVAVSTAVPAGGSPASAIVLFGAWSQLLVGYWSGLDLLANPYDSASYLRGRVMLRALRDCDVAVRHPESFAVASDLPL
jgi:HK97 family phage major capsid protein